MSTVGVPKNRGKIVRFGELKKELSEFRGWELDLAAVGQPLRAEGVIVWKLGWYVSPSSTIWISPEVYEVRSRQDAALRHELHSRAVRCRGDNIRNFPHVLTLIAEIDPRNHLNISSVFGKLRAIPKDTSIIGYGQIVDTDPPMVWSPTILDQLAEVVPQPELWKSRLVRTADFIASPRQLANAAALSLGGKIELEMANGITFVTFDRPTGRHVIADQVPSLFVPRRPALRGTAVASTHRAGRYQLQTQKRIAEAIKLGTEVPPLHGCEYYPLILDEHCEALGVDPGDVVVSIGTHLVARLFRETVVRHVDQSVGDQRRVLWSAYLKAYRETLGLAEDIIHFIGSRYFGVRTLSSGQQLD